MKFFPHSKMKFPKAFKKYRKALMSLAEEHNFLQVASTDQGFGYSYSILSNKDMLIRIEVERGVFWVACASVQDNDKWVGMPEIQAIVLGDDSGSAPIDIEVETQFIRDNYQTLRNLLSTEGYPKTLRKLQDVMLRRSEKRKASKQNDNI